MNEALQELTKVLNTLTTEGKEAFVAWLWMRGTTNVMLFVGGVGVALAALRTVFLLVKNGQKLEAVLKCSKCKFHANRYHDDSYSGRDHRKAEKCEDVRAD